MKDPELVAFSSDEPVFRRANAAYARLTVELSRLLPGARFEHVGGTALPGTLTKGDLDIQVIVGRDEFPLAREALSRRYQTNAGALDSTESASFKDDAENPPLGVHLTVAGCDDDFQWIFRDVLLRRADLREEYDALKRGFEGKSMHDYRRAKEGFFERLRSTSEFLRTLGRAG